MRSLPVVVMPAAMRALAASAYPGGAVREPKR
jgi:hypothetical protein